MTYAEVRELVRVRHELRRLAAQGRSAEGQALIARLRALAAVDEDERAAVEPELLRWELSLSGVA